MVERLRLEAQQQRVNRLPGIGHGAVEPAESLDDFVDDAFHRRTIRHVALEELRGSAGTRIRAGLDTFAQCGDVAPDESDVRAASRELDGDRASDPTAPAGDQGRLAREIHTLAPAGDSSARWSRSIPEKSVMTLAGGAPLIRFISALSTPLAPNSTTMSG